MRRKSWIPGIVVGIAVVCLLRVPARSQPPETGYVDVHTHLFGRVGGPNITPGAPGSPGPGAGPPGADWDAAARNLLDQMTRYGVTKVIMLPPPRTSRNIDRDEVPALFRLQHAFPGRLYAAAGGETLNAMIHESAPSAVTQEVKDRFVRETERIAAMGAKAFGEMTALHLSFNQDHPFEEQPPDHPLFLLLAEVAARRGIPIDLHMEAVPTDTPLPPGFDRVSRNNPASLRANIPGLERLLTSNRGARIVWQHIGWDNTGQMTIQLLRRLLQAHPNLFLALRVEERPRTVGGTPMPNRIVDGNGQIRAEWLAFLSEFPERFVVGADEFFGVPGRSPQFPKSFELTWQLVRQLPADLARKIGRDNAMRIYNLQ